MALAIRERIQERAAPFLQPGETVQYAFAAQSANPYWSILSYWIIVIQNAYRAVAVTDRRIIVFQSSRLAFSKLKSVKCELPRATCIGPVSGIWAKTNTLGEQLYIHKRFHKDVQAADSAAGFTTA
jgi:hypothetical protein